MAIQPSLSYEWYIPDRIYIIYPVGVFTPHWLDIMEAHLLDMLHEPYRTQPVHMIFDASRVHFDHFLVMRHLERCSVNLYREPLTGSILTVTGMNRFYTFIANTMSQMLARKPHQGRAMRTLNEAIRFALYIDSTLPPMNV